MSKNNEFEVSELILFSLIHRYILRFVKLPNSNKNNVCYNDANCSHILCRSHRKKMVLLKFIEPSVWPPTARTWTRLITPYMRGTDFRPGRSQRPSAYLLGESWSSDHRQIYWSLAWQTEGCGSTEWWTYWTVVLTSWFICCSALLCIVCILTTVVCFAIVYLAFWWYCD